MRRIIQKYKSLVCVILVNVDISSITVVAVDTYIEELPDPEPRMSAPTRVCESLPTVDPLQPDAYLITP